MFETHKVGKRHKEKEDAASDITALISKAPSLDHDTLVKMCDEVIQQDPKKLVGLAPFLGKEDLDKLVSENREKFGKSIAGLAPFLSGDALDDYVVWFLSGEGCDTKELTGLAPFLTRATIQRIVDYLNETGNSKGIVHFAPFMRKGELAGMVGSGIRHHFVSDGKKSPHMDDEDA